MRPERIDSYGPASVISSCIFSLRHAGKHVGRSLLVLILVTLMISILPSLQVILIAQSFQDNVVVDIAALMSFAALFGQVPWSGVTPFGVMVG